MTDLAFTQPERSKLAPILIAAAVLALTAAAVFYFNPHDTAALTLSRTSATSIRTNFKSESIVVGEAPSGQDDLYVLTTLRIENHLRLPLTLDTITATLTTADGQENKTSAVAKNDLPAVFTAFPQLKPQQAPPLLPETVIDPKQSTEGQIVLHFPIKKELWDARKSATIEVDLYHQTPITIEIPKP